MSEELNNKMTIYEALAELQYEIVTIKKNQTVNVGKFKFNYADLTSIREALRGPLHKFGFSICQTMEGGVLTTQLIHKSGEKITTSVQVPATTDLKTLGSALTYLRRYSIATLLNLVSDDDVDTGSMEAAGENIVRHQITEDELMRLVDLLNECGEEYSSKIKKGLKHAYKIDSLINLSPDLYQRVYKAAKEYKSQKEKE